MNAKICEIFYSLQLEGSFLGYAACFVRFSMCNLNCYFCDTKYAFNEYTTKSLDEVESIVSKHNCKRIIFTGGEPLLHADFIKAFIELFGRKYEFFLETNGTIWIDFACAFKHIVVSPKLDNIDSNVINKFSALNNVEFKILVEDASSLPRIERFIKEFNLRSATLQPIYFPNEAIDDFTLRTRKIIEAFKKSHLANDDVRLIIQNHKVIYGDKRGV